MIRRAGRVRNYVIRGFLGLVLLITCTPKTAAQAYVETGKRFLIEYDRTKGLVLHHTILPGQTVYRLSKLFGVSAEEIGRINRIVDETDIKPGTHLLIPFRPDILVKHMHDLEDKTYYRAVYFKVSKKDNLFRIARRYLDSSVDYLKTINRLDNNRLKENQRLLIGWIPVSEPVAVKNLPARPREEPPRSGVVPAEADIKPDRNPAMPTGRTESGVAFWNKSASESGGGIYILHRYAPKGTEVEITNPMFDKKVRAIITGNFPQDAYARDILMIVTPAVARKLGALDSRFFVKVRYLPAGMTREESDK